jgi:predicted Zn-dependent protease
MTVSPGIGTVRLLLTLTVVSLVFSLGPVVTAADSSSHAESRKLVGRAHEEIAVGHADSALVTLSSVLDIDPNNPDAHYLIGKVKLSLADTAGAEEILVRGMELAPLSSRIKLLLAKVKLARNAPDEAEALVSQVLAIKPHNSEGNYLLGCVALARGDTTGTLDLWAKALVEEVAGGGR